MKRLKESYRSIGIACCLIILGVSMRLLPHPANFAPVTAIALFSGAYLPRKIAVWVPLVAMIISDWVIGFYSLMYLVWGCYVVIACLSSMWLRKPTLFRATIGCVAASIFFYVVTNFGVWAASGMYVHSWPGLFNCYLLALPFFRNSSISDLGYMMLLFGLYRLATHHSTSDLRLTAAEKQ